MAFDGITVAAVVSELNRTVVGGKINKIAQPEAEELMITVKNHRTQYRLFLSAILFSVRRISQSLTVSNISPPA